MKRVKIYFFLLIYTLLLSNCVKDKNFDSLKSNCVELTANITFQELVAMHTDDIIQIQEDFILEGFVVSSDSEGNFFGAIHVQDLPQNPTMGISFHLDLRDYHLLYPNGSKIVIKLKGLYLDKRHNAFEIGGVFSSFGNLTVGRLPSLQVQQHLFLDCNNEKATATITTINELTDASLNTLIQLESVEIIEDEIDLTFAEPQEETERTLADCDGNEITLINSGYSDFQAEIMPNGNGSISGVLVKDNNDYQLQISATSDIDFNNERCPETEFTSTAVFISELADPNNNAGARFVELYNSATESLSLKGWILRRYTNENTEVSSFLDLTEYTIGAESTLVISPNATEFEAVYGFAPDISTGTSSPADSNGDDNLELVDPFGTVIDVFGVIGEDGTNTNHEFEDGKAVRKSEITQANIIYTFTEWTIFNDTGSAGTTNLPQNAPDDFTPGAH